MGILARIELLRTANLVVNDPTMTLFLHPALNFRTPKDPFFSPFVPHIVQILNKTHLAACNLLRCQKDQLRYTKYRCSYWRAFYVLGSIAPTIS